MKKNLIVKFVVLIALGLILGACVATQGDVQRAMDSQATQVARQIDEAVASIPEVDPNEIAEQVIAAMPTQASTQEPTLEPTTDPVLTALESIVDRLDQMGSGSQDEDASPSAYVPIGVANVPAGFPATAEEFLALIGVPCGSELNCLDLTVEEISACPGEVGTCWRALREKDENAVIVPFMATNPSSCMQDGYMDSVDDRVNLGRKEPPTAVGSGVPAGYTGLLQGFTYRATCP